MRRGIAIALAGAGSLVVWGGAATAKMGGVIPKGTPYAAEVRMQVTGQAIAEEVQTLTTYNVCEAEPQTVHNDFKATLNWKATYNQVTVPVMTPQELGAAAKRLFVKVTPTSNGTGGLASGSYDANGTTPSDPNSCDAVNYTSSGTYADGGSVPTFEDNGDLNGLPRLFFDVGAPGAATPGDFMDATGDDYDPAQIEGTIFSTIPSAADDPTGLNGAADVADFGADFDAAELRQLAEPHPGPVELTPITRNGMVDCGSEQDPDVSSLTCTITYTFAYRVTMTRHSLYRTQRAYSR